MRSRARIRMLVGTAILTCGGLAIMTAQQPQAGDDPRFTGRSDVLEAKDVAAGRRRFEAGARTAWHSHEKGQLLFVEEGRARVQRRGQPMRELAKGDSDYTAPNVVHWHGAVPHTHYIQVALTFGGETTWLERTTAAQYEGKP